MNDDRSPIDDELLSAVLDGEATPAERARVAASPEGQRRLEQLRAAAARVAETVTPLAGSRVDDMVARALAEAPEPSTAAGDDPWLVATGRPRHAAPGSAPQGRPWLRRAGLAAAGLAVVALLAVGVAGLAGRSGRESADSSASGGSTALSTEGAGDGANAAADATSGSGATGSAVAVDLGALPDAQAVLARFAALESASPDFEHQFSDEGVDRSPPAPAEATAAAPGGCPVPPVEVRPGETWSTVAQASLPSGAVLVMAGRTGAEAPRLLVVDAATCAVLAEADG